MTFFTQALISGVLAGAIYGLLGVGLSLCYKTTGIINVAQGDIAIFGAYVAMTMSEWHLPLAVAAIGGIAAGAAIAALMERTVLRPVYSRGVVAPILVTVGVSTALGSIIQLAWGSAPRQLSTLASTVPWRFSGLAFTPNNLTILLVAIAVSIGIAVAVERTRIGRAMRGCAQDSEVVSLLGIPASRLYFISFCVAGATAGLAGVLIAPTTGLLPNSGFGLTIPGFAAAVLGGLGSLPGAIVGGIAIGVLHNLASVYINPSYADAVEYVAIAVVLLVSTRGLFGDELETVRRV